MPSIIKSVTNFGRKMINKLRNKETRPRQEEPTETAIDGQYGVEKLGCLDTATNSTIIGGCLKKLGELHKQGFGGLNLKAENIFISSDFDISLDTLATDLTGRKSDDFFDIGSITMQLVVGCDIVSDGPRGTNIFDKIFEDLTIRTRFEELEMNPKTDCDLLDFVERCIDKEHPPTLDELLKHPFIRCKRHIELCDFKYAIMERL